MKRDTETGIIIKGPRKRRNKSGLLIHVPISGMTGDEFNNLVSQNPVYRQILIKYFKDTGVLEGLNVDNYKQISLYDIQRVYYKWVIHTKTNSYAQVAARCKKDALDLAKISLNDCKKIVRVSRSGSMTFLKTK